MDGEEAQGNKALLDEHRRRLQALQIQKARKGISTPPEILNEIEDIQAEIARLRSEASAASLNTASPRYKPSNLSVKRTPLIGREQEVATVQKWLAETQIITLTGPGGVGKTRLAIEVATVLRAAFDDAVYFVDLASTASPSQVVGEIARAIGAAQPQKEPDLETVKSYLHDRPTLLVLDNFEHVIAAASQITTLLDAAPDLKILVTSRVALDSDGRRFPVEPLAPPDLPDLPPQEIVRVIEANPAVELFIQFARTNISDFNLTSANRVDVYEICRRLEGLPLAIRLAASSVSTFTPKELLSQLERSFDLLDQDVVALPMHQRTMRATLRWSYDLLNPKAQDLFTQLAVFDGGWTLEALEAICFGVSNTDGSSSADAVQSARLQDLQALVDASLLRRTTVGEKSRYSMLELIREYARELLLARSALDQIERRHADYYLALAQKAESGLSTELLEELEREHSNLRRALKWAQDHNEVEIFLRLSSALWRFWYTHGHLKEGAGWLKAALESSDCEWNPVDLPEDQQPLRKLELWAKALNGAGGIAWAQGEYEPAERFYQESLSLYREIAVYDEIGSRRGIATAHNNLGLVAQHRKEVETAKEYYEESLEIFRMLKDRLNTARLLNNLGVLAHDQGDEIEARRRHEESLALCHELNDPWEIAGACLNLGVVLRALNELSEAADRLLEGLEKYAEDGDKEGVAHCLRELAGVAAARGEFIKAAQLWGADAALREALSIDLPPLDIPGYERDVADARAQIDAATWEEAQAKGKKLPLAKVIDIAKSLRSSEEGGSLNEDAVNP